MRLTDRCSISRNNQTLYGSTPCAFVHVEGDRHPDPEWPSKYLETARIIVGPLAQLVGVNTPADHRVEHKGVTYKVSAIFPRYRAHGRLHHVSLDLERVSG